MQIIQLIYLGMDGEGWIWQLRHYAHKTNEAERCRQHIFIVFHLQSSTYVANKRLFLILLYPKAISLCSRRILIRMFCKVCPISKAVKKIIEHFNYHKIMNHNLGTWVDQHRSFKETPHKDTAHPVSREQGGVSGFRRGKVCRPGRLLFLRSSPWYQTGRHEARWHGAYTYITGKAIPLSIHHLHLQAVLP